MRDAGRPGEPDVPVGAGPPDEAAPVGPDPLVEAALGRTSEVGLGAGDSGAADRSGADGGRTGWGGTDGAVPRGGPAGRGGVDGVPSDAGCPNPEGKP
ncbi:hypothetical protein ACFVU0_31800 [Streptomyces sp. NPDC058122]|uniref:hypothetical protein n=1 Tax=Streptomyces sp. NPDC058122 TaxID=3346349 RepID=UPI0036E1298B